MKKTSLVTIAIVAMMVVGSVQMSWAGDASVDGDGNAVGLDLHNENNSSVSGVNTQEQGQDQQQQQRQEQQATGGSAEVNYNAPSVVVAPVALAGVVGGHPGSPAVVVNGGGGNGGAVGVVGGQSMAVGGTLQSAMPGWTPFVCRPLWQTYTSDRIKASAVPSKFGDRKGGLWHRLGREDSNGVPHALDFKAYDGKPVHILNWQPAGSIIHEGDELLDDRICEGDYGQPWDAALGRCLSELVEKTGTHRVSAYYKIRRDPKNSGASLGSGAAAGGIAGTTGGMVSLGGLIGTTSAYVDEAVDWYVLALNDGLIEAPPGADMCVGQLVIQRSVVVEEIPPGPEVCDPRPIIIKIEDLKRKVIECKLYCFNNLGLRRDLVEAYIDLYVCTGNREYLRDAIENAEIAERNYLRGHDIKAHKAEADKEIAQVYYFWAGCINILDGERAAMSFAESKHLERFPKGFK
ncbi:MAG: hypothetical protein WC120_03405 [Parcubacteria group bacterium]